MAERRLLSARHANELSIKNAHGHGPEGVIDKIRAVLKTADFDRIYAVLDADIPCTAAQKAYLQTLHVACLISDPAIEATLLAILASQCHLQRMHANGG